MKAWKPLWRWLAASTGLVVLVAVAIVVLGPGSGGASTGARSPGEARSTAAGKTPSSTAAPVDQEALVNRMLDQIRAGKPVEPQFAAGDNPAAGAPIEAIKAKPGEELRLGQLSIPRLRVSEPLNNGVDEAALVHGVGHWPGTPLPGSRGNSVVSGHRSTHDKPFLYLDKLRPGDPIVATVGSKRTTYRVVKTTIVPQAEYVKFILRQPADAGAKVITLFACNPITAHYQRIVVQARAD
ncbi:class E sortase [Kribbella sp. NPDC051586]|uniref:class E sortase n=1 Tax=Kribbella sp. NPDC051586 TaxID=3364118 RepID=UPI0037A07D86